MILSSARVCQSELAAPGLENAVYFVVGQGRAAFEGVGAVPGKHVVFRHSCLCLRLQGQEATAQEGAGQ